MKSATEFKFRATANLNKATTLLSRLGMSNYRSRGAKALIGNLITAAKAAQQLQNPSVFVITPLDDSWKCPLDPTINGKSIRRAKDVLEKGGWLTVVKLGNEAEGRTRIKPTKKFRKLVCETKIEREIDKALEFISQGKPIITSTSYSQANGKPTGPAKVIQTYTRSSPRLKESFEVMKRHRKALEASKIEMPKDFKSDEAETIVASIEHTYSKGNYVFALHRTYRSDVAVVGQRKANHMRGGGRYYHGALQIPDVDRQRMRVNGERLVEIDVVSCQPRVLMALNSLDLGDVDIYTQLGGKREVGKKILLWLLGTSSPTKSNLTSFLGSEFGPDYFSTEDREEIWKTITTEFATAFTKRYPEPGSLGGPKEIKGGAWLETQKAESEWLTRVMLRHYAHHTSTPIFPWHDSILAPESVADDVERIMREEWKRKFGFDVKLKRESELLRDETTTEEGQMIDLNELNQLPPHKRAFAKSKMFVESLTTEERETPTNLYPNGVPWESMTPMAAISEAKKIIANLGGDPEARYDSLFSPESRSNAPESSPRANPSLPPQPEPETPHSASDGLSDNNTDWRAQIDDVWDGIEDKHMS